jgi:hypothetical protein
MSKRRNRKKNASPNLPRETLERARREAGLEPETEPEPVTDELAEEEAEALADEAVDEAEAPAAPLAARRSARSRRGDGLPGSATRVRRRKEVPVEELTQAEIAERLANPVRFPTVEEMRAQYLYVLGDLRSMALLAAALFVALIVAATIII